MRQPRRTLRVAPYAVLVVVVLGACGSGSGAATSSTSGPGTVPSTSRPATTSSTSGPATDTPASTSVPTASTAPASSLPEGIQAAVPVGDGPITLAATDDAIWVELHRANMVSKVDPVEGLEVAQFDLITAHCEVAVGNGYVWASNAHVSVVSRIEPDTGDVVGELNGPSGCGLAVDDHDLWVTSPSEASAIRFDPDTLAERATVELGDSVFGIAIGSDAVWAQGEAGGGTVWRIEPATNAMTGEIAAPGASGIAVGLDSVWVAARNRAVVYRIDPATNSVAATIELPGVIGGIGVGLDSVWVSSFGSGWVSRIDPYTDQVTGSFSTEYARFGPPITAFGSVWVAALDENVVVRIDPAAVTDSN